MISEVASAHEDLEDGAETGDVAAFVADVVAEWVRRLGQPVDLILTGPAGGHYRTASETTTTVELDVVEFCRIVSGREPGERLLATRVLF